MLIIVGAFLFNALVLVAVTALMQVVFDDSPIAYPWVDASLLAIIIVATQVIFVLPLVNPPTVSLYGKSLKVSMVLAGLFGAICSLVLLVGFYSFVTSLIFNSPKQDSVDPTYFVVAIGVSWIVWSVCLFVFVQRSPRDANPLVRLTGILFAGSLIELLLSIPLTAMVARRSNCYCETGSFFALAFSVLASLWLFGPFIVISLYWRARPWSKDHCLHCGYPQKVRNADVCSECGRVLEKN